MVEDVKKYGSRKFIVAMTIIIGATALCGCSKIDGGAYLASMAIAGGGYQLANVWEQKKQG